MGVMSCWLREVNGSRPDWGVWFICVNGACVVILWKAEVLTGLRFTDTFDGVLPPFMLFCVLLGGALGVAGIILAPISWAEGMDGGTRLNKSLAGRLD